MTQFFPRLIHGDTKLLGLLGQNTSYTLSPSMHNRAIQGFGLDQIYVNFDLEAASVPAFLGVFWKLGGVGLNITKPHKSLVASLVPGHSLKSINTLVRGTSGWEGHSTDGKGFSLALERIRITANSIETLIFMGAGGAAQSIAAHLLSLPGHSLKKIVVLRRDTTRDRLFAEIVGSEVSLEFHDWNPGSLKAALQDSTRSSLLVQAASVAGNSGAPALAEFTDALDGFNGAFVDLIYDKPTALYFSALHHGIRAQDGLPMLVEQARLSQKLWWGKAASYDDMIAAIKHTGILK